MRVNEISIWISPKNEEFNVPIKRVENWDSQQRADINCTDGCGSKSDTYCRRIASSNMDRVGLMVSPSTSWVVQDLVQWQHITAQWFTSSERTSWNRPFGDFHPSALISWGSEVFWPMPTGFHTGTSPCGPCVWNTLWIGFIGFHIYMAPNYP